MLYFEQTTVSLDWRLNTILLTNFENLNSISNIFQETLHFLVLPDPRIICIYLIYFIYLHHQRQTLSSPGERPSFSLRVTKMCFGLNIKYLSESFRIFTAGKAFLAFLNKEKGKPSKFIWFYLYLPIILEEAIRKFGIWFSFRIIFI